MSDSLHQAAQALSPQDAPEAQPTPADQYQAAAVSPAPGARAPEASKSAGGAADTPAAGAGAESQEVEAQGAVAQDAKVQNAGAQDTAVQKAGAQDTAAQEAGAESAAAEVKGAVAQDADGAPPVFKMGDDVSAYTGRPRFTPEDNKALAQSSRFFRQAMTTAARARGEEYEPFQLPAKMRAELAKIDEEAAQLKYEEALKAGLSEEEAQAIKEQSYSSVAQLHAVDPEEDEELRQARREEQRIASGGARFYHKYQELLQKQQEHQAANKAKIKSNLKIALVVIVGLMGYMAYNQLVLNKDASSIEELKAALPLTIDETTAMVRIDDRNDDFRIFFEKDPKAFEGWDEHQKQAALDQFAKNAPLLCKNQLLNHIITSGKKVTVILEATDRSFSRQYSVDQCPTNPAQ